MFILLSIITVIVIITALVAAKVINSIRVEVQRGLDQMGQDIGQEIDNHLSNIPFFRTK